MKTILKIFLLTLVVACNLTKKIPENKCICTGKIFKTVFTHKDALNVFYYQSDDFTAKAIEEYTIASVRKKYSNQLKLTLIPVKNRYKPNIVDTLYEFSNKQSIIQFYRASNADFIQRFDISDPIFKLAGCVSVGQLKNNITKQFGIKEKIGDTITIGNIEHTSAFTFYFKNNRIVRISSYQYLD